MSLDTEKIIGKLAVLGLSQKNLGRLADIPEKQLGLRLKGLEPLSGPEAERLNAILDDLGKLRDSISPFELPLEDSTKLKVLLRQFCDGFLVDCIDRTVVAGLRDALSRVRR